MSKLRELLLAGAVIFSVGVNGESVLSQSVRDAVPLIPLEENLKSKLEIEELKESLPVFRKKLEDLRALEKERNQDIRDLDLKLQKEKVGGNRKDLIEAYLDQLESYLLQLKAVLHAKQVMEDAIALSEKKLRTGEGKKTFQLDYPQKR